MKVRLNHDNRVWIDLLAVPNGCYFQVFIFPERLYVKVCDKIFLINRDGLTEATLKTLNPEFSKGTLKKLKKSLGLMIWALNRR